MQELTENDEIIPEPQGLNLKQNYPNPFNPVTTIRYYLPQDDFVDITVYNTRGQIITNLENDFKHEGDHSVIWNATDQNGKEVSAGVYFYTVKSGSFHSTKKMLLMK